LDDHGKLASQRCTQPLKIVSTDAELSQGPTFVGAGLPTVQLSVFQDFAQPPESRRHRAPCALNATIVEIDVQPRVTPD
jgi:hypothetical protein